MTTCLWKRRYRLLAAALLLLLVAVAWKGVIIYQAAVKLQADARHLVAVGKQYREEPSAALLGDLRAAAAQSAGDISALRVELRPLDPLLRASASLPGGMAWAAGMPDLLAFADPMGQAGAAFLRRVETSALASSDAVSSRSLVAVQSPQDAAYIDAKLAEAEEAFAPLEGRALGGPLAQSSGYLQLLGAALPEIRRNLPLLESLVPALGFGRSRTYLLLGQNNHEIRATGGFIGTAGVLTVRNGSIEQLKYGSSYTMDDRAAPLAPPYPLARYLGLGGWYLRDSNWWPDFPSSAAQAEMAWTRAGNPPVDGVIAFDTEAMKMVLRATGGVEVPGAGTVTADNYERVAAEQFYSRNALTNQQTFDTAKNSFLAAMGPVLIRSLAEMSPERLLPMVAEAERLLDEKHIQMVFKDPRLISAVHARGWDGSISTDAPNPLLVVDSTMCYGDTYSFITPEAKIAVQEREDGSQVHEVVLHYTNKYPQGLPAWASPKMVGSTVFDQSTGKSIDVPGFWADWLRVYLPATARDISVSGLSDQQPVETESGRSVVSGYFKVPAGESWEVRIRYVNQPASPGQVERRGDYELLWQKQAGLNSRPVSLVVQWADGATSSVEASPATDQRVSVSKPRN